eukprot:9971522-Karenia_brevis.AAC.1
MLTRPIINDTPCLKTRNMCFECDVDEQSAPSTTDADTALNVNEKVHQIGTKACVMLLKHLLEGIEFESRRAMIIVDLGNRWNDMGRAMISIQSSCAIPMYYMSVNEEA